SDEDSLRLFKPASLQEMQAEEYINNHPLALELRANPAFKESRPTLKLREDLRTSSLTSGVFAGPGRIVVPPVMFVEEGGKSSVVIMYLGNEMCGYPGMIHGGVLATLLDEGLARCAFEALPNKLAMTATLNINYRKPSPADNFVVLRARTTKVERRKAWVEGQIETLPKTPEETPVVLAEATALMIEPRQAEVRGKFMSD
ncbi:Thioesterase/thiol ester dehydrase-isomerase, partial [Ascodesmis nigricans]